MKSFKNYLLAGSGLVLLLGSFILSAPRVTQGQGGDPIGPPKPVQVVNTPAEPVPVTGSITGEVNVANTVRVSDAPRQPFNQVHQVFLPEGVSEDRADLFTVPAGKQLIVTYASAEVILNAGQKLLLLVAIHPLVPVLVGPVRSARDSSVASEPVSFSLSAGEVLSVVAIRSDDAGAGTGFISVSGYLLDVP